MRAWPALLLSLALPQIAVAVELVGKTMPPYPEGLREVGDACLSDSTDTGHFCDYSIGLLADANGDPDAEPVMRYVTAGRLAGRDGPSALWKVTDAQAYPKVAKGFFWQAGTCRLDKVEDPRLIAVVRQGLQQEIPDRGRLGAAPGPEERQVHGSRSRTCRLHQRGLRRTVTVGAASPPRALACRFPP